MTTPSLFFRTTFIMSMLAMFGLGCQSTTTPSVPAPATTPTQTSTPAAETLSSHELSEHINFVPGSFIEMRQTILGFGTKASAKLPTETNEGMRTIVIVHFAPMERADITWKLITKKQTTVGSLDGIDLKTATSLYLPSYWSEEEHAASLGRSALWLPMSAYEGLSRTRVATLDFGIISPEGLWMVNKIPAIRDVLLKLKSAVAKIQDRTDVYKVDADQALAEWPLKVNGKDLKVEVIKAHSWFGEIVVLNNKQNPLVLKITLDPVAAAASDVSPNSGIARALVGYEITSLNDVSL